MSGSNRSPTAAAPSAIQPSTVAPLEIDDARAALYAAVESLPAFPQSPLDAIGGVLARPLLAAEALPGAAVSAMDGYAVSDDGPWRLDASVRCAGSYDNMILQRGHAVRVATGARLPTGAHTVIRDEYVDVDRPAGGTAMVSRKENAPVRNDSRSRGEDWLPGAVLAGPGTAVTPALVSVALSAEVPELLVRGPVRGHIVLTGTEIRRRGPLLDGQTRDSLGPVLPSFLAGCGVRTTGDTYLRDTALGFDDVLSGRGVGQDTRDAHLLVIVGATGGGAADHLRRALARSGAQIVVGRVRCRPGSSQIVAILADGRILLGLPGNPYAAVAVLLLIMPTVVAALIGAPRPTPLIGVIPNAGDVDSDVTRLVPATLGRDGRWWVTAQVRTAHLVELIGAQAVAVIAPGLPDGGLAELLPLSGHVQ